MENFKYMLWVIADYRGLNPVTNIALQGQGGVTNEYTNGLCQRHNLRRTAPTVPILAPGLLVFYELNE